MKTNGERIECTQRRQVNVTDLLYIFYEPSAVSTTLYVRSLRTFDVFVQKNL